jgi:hypothetical protein
LFSLDSCFLALDPALLAASSSRTVASISDMMEEDELEVLVLVLMAASDSGDDVCHHGSVSVCCGFHQNF